MQKKPNIDRKYIFTGRKSGDGGLLRQIRALKYPINGQFIPDYLYIVSSKSLSQLGLSIDSITKAREVRLGDPSKILRGRCIRHGGRSLIFSAQYGSLPPGMARYCRS